MIFPQVLLDTLLAAYGPQQWWPAKSIEEMMVGAVLVQNTAWTQVAKVIEQLERLDLLAFLALRQIPEERLWQVLRPVGFFRVKSRRLKALAQFMADYQDQPDWLFQTETAQLRDLLLQVHGIGKETADAILCYGAGRPLFVVDAYGKRLLHRLGWIGPEASYDEVQSWVQARLPADAVLLGEFHALIVQHAKLHCRVRPLCLSCPLLFCPLYGSVFR